MFVITVFFELTLQKRLLTAQSLLYVKSNKSTILNHIMTLTLVLFVDYGFLFSH